MARKKQSPLSKKLNKISWKAWVSGIVGLVLVLTGGSALANTSFDDLLASKLAEKVTKSDILGLLDGASDVLGLSTISSSATGLIQLRLAGAFQRRSSSSTDYYYVTQTDIETWPAASSSIRFSNGRSTTSTVKRVLIWDSRDAAAVSSTVLFSCGNVNANPNYTYNSAQGTRPGGVIDGYQAATSSVVFFDSLSTTTPSVQVGPGESLDCIAQAQAEQDLICNSDGVQCESVTSTNRGWQADVLVEWEWQEGIR